MSDVEAMIEKLNSMPFEQRQQVLAEIRKGPKWHEATMLEAIKHAHVREVSDDLRRPEGIPFDYDVVVFVDGTAIACRSSVSGPYSEVTPDIDSHNPVWQIYR